MRAALSVAAVSLSAVAAVLVFQVVSGGASSDDAPAVAATVTATPTPQRTATARPTNRPTAEPTPAPAPPTPGPDGVVAGGDQPSGPVPGTVGDLPEVVNASADILELRDKLQGEINSYSASNGGIDVAVAVTDLQTGETISVNGNAPHKTGCVINLFALLAAVGEFQAGNDSPSSYAGLIKTGIGGSHPPEVRAFLDGIFGSHQTGVQRAREMMAGWGMKVASFDHVPYYGGSNPPPNILTALETIDILNRLWHRQLFNPDWSAYTVNVLRDSYYYVDYILPKYIPYTAQVGHKIGYHWDYDGWVNNDVGIVTFTGADGTEKSYSIAYFSQYAPSEYAGYSFGARISLLVWNFMAPRYGLSPEPEPIQLPPPPPTPIATPTPLQTPTVPATAPPKTPVPTPTATPFFSYTRPPSAPAPTPTPTVAP